MKNFIRTILGGILAGFAISMGALAYLNVQDVLGALFFAFGLCCVIIYDVPLFTGKAYKWHKKWDVLLIIWLVLLCNILGAYIFGNFAEITDNLRDTAGNIISKRFEWGWLKSGIMAIGCGMAITAGVKSAAVAMGGRSWVALILGVAVFIICGFPHCVADIFYATISNQATDYIFSWEYLSVIIGNYIGCNIICLAKLEW